MTLSIDQWWDRHSRVWITTIKDERGYQVGDALLSGNRASAAADRKYAEHLIATGQASEETE